jgi:CDP-diacylglycerol--serine O-phosphatidyltransferase
MKKIYLLPNMVTTANLLSGFLSMTYSFKGEFTKAAWFIIIGAVCDSLDGRIARMARATSPFGVQYDSLSDLISFGTAPAILLFSYALHEADRFGVSVAALYVVCAALRLARFNVGVEDPSPSQLKKIRKGYFQGLPSPASAGLIVTAVLVQVEFAPLGEATAKYFLMALGALLGFLMVSNIPFPSFKEVNWRSKGNSWMLFVPVAVILFGIQSPSLTLFSIGYAYLFGALGWAAYLCLVRDKNQQGVGFEKHT